jgi:hypothetical protein
VGGFQDKAEEFLEFIKTAGVSIRSISTAFENNFIVKI